ncbi:unnamed protein product [Rotaria sp. Silwood1]|nr:unnamed protein product [Rotaria sp. Silwood1]CAF3361573.1 unnamed protein product [Rotaria sp. Silwood1]CAF4568464.1 unnamed protein product [Rotaria sp. Silwood1]
MTTRYRIFNSDHLGQAWSLLNEYNDFCCIAQHRKKVEEQLHNANIPLIYVPWKSMVRTLLCRSLFSDKQLKEMNIHTDQCCTEVDIAASQAIVNFLLENNQQNEKNLTETWFEINQLKECFQKAINILPANRHERLEMFHKILGYPTGYSEKGIDDVLNNKDDIESLDLNNVLSIDKQRQMHTGDLIEFSGNRLHDAFYIYRLPAKGIWTQIQQMWSKHQITNFIFNNAETDLKEDEIILVPAMDEYGYGVPYLFATRPTELLPDGALHKYVDINCPLVSMHKQNPTIALVQQHLNERLKNPVYQDKYMNVEMSVELHRFPQEYVAFVHINDAPKDNVLWTQRVHYNGKEIARDLNDNLEIFFSRRILESEEQYKQTKKVNI